MDGFWGNLIAGLITLVIGLFFERWFGVTKWPGLLIKKMVQKSPQQIRQFILAIGWKVDVNQGAQQDGPRLGTIEEALGTPGGLPNERRPSAQGFLLVSLSALLADETERLGMRSDYENGMNWIQNGDSRGAASTLVRAYNPVVRVLEERGHRDYANALRREITKLSEFGIGGIPAEDILITISNIDTIFHNYFQKNR